MIYIDPPYNTGGDGFVYNDDRKFTKEQLSELAAIDSDEAERILEFTASNSNSHSAWLTFIYPRLYIARELLKEDGIIFISIDENENSQLKILCDEIFGESNILGVVANVNNPKGRSDDKFIATAHEYLLVASKDSSKAKTYGFEPEEKITKRYNKVDENGKQYREMDLRKTGDEDRREDRKDMFYYFYFDESTQILTLSKEKLDSTVSIEIYPIREDGTDGRWRWGFDTARKNINNIYPKFMPKRKIWGIVEKDYLIGRPPVKPTSAWTFKDVNTERGSEQFIGLGFQKEIFPKPKPVGIISRTLQVGVIPNEKAIVLDFFAGSGTLSQAVHEYNLDNNANVEFICVQLSEETDRNKDAYKAGYKTIFDITKARIEKSAKKIKAENPDYQSDLGFKLFETVDDFRRDNNALTLENLSFFDDEVLTGEQYQSLLTTWSLYDGSLLTDNIVDIALADYKAHYCNGRLYLLAPHFTINALKALLLKLDNDADFSPHKVVLYGDNFDSAKQRELNEALSSYANKKSLELDIVVRN